MRWISGAKKRAADLRKAKKYLGSRYCLAKGCTLEYKPADTVVPQSSPEVIMRESEVEKYLHREVVKAGGFTYKFKSPGRRNVPDRIVLWPIVRYQAEWGGSNSRVLEPTVTGTRAHFVECKAPGKNARAGQAREHVRLQKLGSVVLVLDTKDKVDNYVERNK